MTLDPPTSQHLPAQIIAASFPERLTDDDAFLVFAILHTYILVLTSPLLNDAPNCRMLYPITQRGAAQALTVLWQHTTDERAQYEHWYWKWNTDWNGYQHLEQLSPEEKTRMRGLKQRIEAHPWIEQLVPEDNDPLA